MDKYRQDVLSFVEAVKDGGKFYCYDTETTGLSPEENEVIEFSAIRYREDEDSGKYVEEARFDTFINIGKPLPEKITEITGITDADLATAPKPDEAAEQIAAFLGVNPILMGYNSVSFDTEFMKALYAKIGRKFIARQQLDVLVMAREKLPKPHKLIDSATAAGCAEGITFHRSIGDVEATFGVFQYILPMYEKEEPKADADGFVVTGVKRWTKSATLDRLYVQNTGNMSVYYDLPLKKWVVNGNIDDQIVIEKVYEFLSVSSNEEMVTKF